MSAGLALAYLLAEFIGRCKLQNLPLTVGVLAARSGFGSFGYQFTAKCAVSVSAVAVRSATCAFGVAYLGLTVLARGQCGNEIGFSLTANRAAGLLFTNVGCRRLLRDLPLSVRMCYRKYGLALFKYKSALRTASITGISGFGAG